MGRSTQAEGEALVLDPHLYPENQKRQKILVNQYGMAERVSAQTLAFPPFLHPESLVQQRVCFRYRLDDGPHRSTYKAYVGAYVGTEDHAPPRKQAKRA